MGSIATEMKNRVDRFVQELKKEADELTEKTMETVITEYSEYQEDEITTIFNDAVTAFYNDYSPGLYTREGNVSSQSGGLYSILEFKRDTDGSLLYDTTHDIEDILNSDNMHSDRSGGSLYNKVFVQGWHGGAESGPDHPNSGTPYYREPHPYYTRWGNPAAKSTSPYSAISENLAKSNGRFDTKYNDILKKHNKELVDAIQTEVMPRLINSIIRRAT